MSENVPIQAEASERIRKMALELATWEMTSEAFQLSVEWWRAECLRLATKLYKIAHGQET